MYELIQVGQNSYYIDCPSKIGVVKCGESDVCLIDSGNGKDTAKKIKKILDTNGWTLRAIYNTHSHADHIGGNRYLQEQTGCAVYAAGIEQDFTRHPILESAFTFGGFPCADLRHKFMLAQESNAEELTEAVLPAGWELIPLDGHSFNMVGFRTPDDVVYLADCLSSEQTLEKYGIPFLYDAEAFLQTLETVKTMKAAMFVPSHAPATTDIAPLAQYNIKHVERLTHTILALCEEPRTFES
ncbi:MAG: MBL fold metallo-hydrolase, partial [Clostridia bacterium]|nr:MBL fold metallo-hydrolase [Clostridia bacterium]